MKFIVFVTLFSIFTAPRLTRKMVLCGTTFKTSSHIETDPTIGIDYYITGVLDKKGDVMFGIIDSAMPNDTNFIETKIVCKRDSFIRLEYRYYKFDGYSDSSYAYYYKFRGGYKLKKSVVYLIGGDSVVNYFK
ncbi:MAG: hypothetical protein EAY68_00710 [Bacteroidetes bacterium]|nr:MAG: hypothetical protein EAY68_00710 [Bacteroidota bacterium]